MTLVCAACKCSSVEEEEDEERMRRRRRRRGARSRKIRTRMRRTCRGTSCANQGPGISLTVGGRSLCGCGLVNSGLFIRLLGHGRRVAGGGGGGQRRAAHKREEENRAHPAY